MVQTASATGTLNPVRVVNVGTQVSGTVKKLYVDYNSTVKEGQVLCIIEAMKLLNEIEAERGGTIKAILIENGQPVEYGEPLFIVG